MRKATRFLLTLPLLLCLTLLGWGSAEPVGVSASHASLLAAASGGETWTMGINVEGPPVYTAVVGRSLSPVGAFRSDRGVREMSFIFPASATPKTVQSAYFYLVSRTGDYTYSATLSLRVYNYAGMLMRTVSDATYPLQDAPVGGWVQVPLPADLARRTVGMGEFLAFHMQLGTAPGETLDVRPIFEVVVQ